MSAQLESSDAPPIRTIWLDWQFYSVLLVCLLLRGLWGCGNLEDLKADPDSYRLLAENIVELHSFTLEDRAEPTAFRPPLYPLLLAATSFSRNFTPIEVWLLHTIIGAFTASLAYYWCRMVGLYRWRMVAGFLVAVDPILLNQSTLVMTETLAAFLVMVVLVAFQAALPRGKEKPTMNDLTLRGLNLAGAVVLAFYCRPPFLLWAILLPIALLLAQYTAKQKATVLTGYVLTVVFLLSPWVVRNWLVFEEPVLLTTHGGYTLLLGNSPEYYEYLESGKEPVFDAKPLQRRLARQLPQNRTSSAELSRNRMAYEMANRTMQKEPKKAAYASLIRLGMFWRPLPNATSSEESFKRTAIRYAVGVFYSVQMIFSALGLFWLGKQLFSPNWLAALSLVLVLTLVHLFFWSNMRMRAPIVPIMVVLACGGFDWVYRRAKKYTP